MMKMASAGAVLLLAVACGGPEEDAPAQEATGTRQERLIEREATRDAFAGRDPEPPFLVSRFAPHRGVPGTQVTLLTAFDSAGCAAAGTCEVTLGGVPMEILEDTHLLVASVPRWADTGELCVRWQSRTECSGTFEMLPAPLVHSAYVSGGSVVLSGEGFTAESRVVLDFNPLETTWQPHGELRAVLPQEHRDHGTALEIRVYSPSSGRCGSYSDPVNITVQ